MNSRACSNQPTPVIKYSHSSNQPRVGLRSKLSALFKFGRKQKKQEMDDVSRLLDGIDKLKVNSKFALESSKSSHKAAKLFAKWGEKGRNSAIDDVMQKTSQMMQLHSDMQKQFAKDYEISLKKLRNVGETELLLKKPVKQLNKARAQERQLQKKIRKLISNEEDTVLLRRQLDQAILARESAEQNLASEIAEIEVAKVSQFREAMMKIANTQKVLATRTLAIFDSQRGITQFLPAVSTHNVNQMMYEGAVYTQECLDELQQWLSNECSPVLSHPLSGSGFARSNRPTIQLVVSRSEEIAPPPYSSTQRALYEFTHLKANNHFGDGNLQTSTPRVNFRL